ncbi:hypothetical protein [Williamsia sp. 1135]|uniref:hypothetical protein n=1 Tax=Williamsia sp. 1135 TaxID=1889262 RepID=UPI00143A030B|nr:hypothetical protein [Williamsia sp. 1135]
MSLQAPRKSAAEDRTHESSGHTARSRDDRVAPDVRWPSPSPLDSWWTQVMTGGEQKGA